MPYQKEQHSKEERQPNVIVKRFSSEYAYQYDQCSINTNNCWSNERRDRPDDYIQMGELHHTKHWVYRFHAPDTVRTLTLDAEDLGWLVKAAVIGSMRRKFPTIYEDELEDTVQKYAKKTAFLEDLTLNDGKGWFVRTERVSLKAGQHGPGPYYVFRDVLQSLVTSRPGHMCIDLCSTADTMTLYFLPFLDTFDRDKHEFRVFVYKNRVTAISQQSFSTPNAWLAHLDKCGELKIMVHDKILMAFERYIRPRMNGFGTDSYTIDLALVGDTLSAYFIETNAFGADYGAGSALFGWRQDEETLHDAETVEFRYCCCEYEPPSLDKAPLFTSSVNGVFMLETKWNGRLLHLRFLSQIVMTSTMMRFSEHYESPQFAGKVFTRTEFENWYRHEYDGNAYGDDWGGHNLPYTALQSFYAGCFNPLTANERYILDALRAAWDRRKQCPFYVIATAMNVKGVEHTERHETAHALYYLCPKYVEKMNQLLDDAVSSNENMRAENEAVRHRFLEIGYIHEVLDDEIQASVVDGHSYTLACYGPTLLNTVKVRAHELFDEFCTMNEGSNKLLET